MRRAAAGTGGLCGRVRPVIIADPNAKPASARKHQPKKLMYSDFLTRPANEPRGSTGSEMRVLRAESLPAQCGAGAPHGSGPSVGGARLRHHQGTQDHPRRRCPRGSTSMSGARPISVRSSSWASSLMVQAFFHLASSTFHASPKLRPGNCSRGPRLSHSTGTDPVFPRRS